MFFFRSLNGWEKFEQNSRIHWNVYQPHCSRINKHGRLVVNINNGDIDQGSRLFLRFTDAAIKRNHFERVCSGSGLRSVRIQDGASRYQDGTRFGIYNKLVFSTMLDAVRHCVVEGAAITIFRVDLWKVTKNNTFNDQYWNPMDIT